MISKGITVMDYVGVERNSWLEKENGAEWGSLGESAHNILQAFYLTLLFKGNLPTIIKGKEFGWGSHPIDCVF